MPLLHHHFPLSRPSTPLTPSSAHRFSLQMAQAALARVGVATITTNTNISFRVQCTDCFLQVSSSSSSSSTRVKHVSLVCCCDPRVAARNLFGAIISCVLFSLVFGGFLNPCEQRVLLTVGTCRARLLHRLLELTPTQECHFGLSSLASKAPVASSQSSSKTEVRQSDSKGSANT